MKTFKIISILFFTFFLFAGVKCKKDKPIYPFIPLDKEFLSYFAFPVGSWWVYEEVSTSQKDSAYVFNYTIEKRTDKKSGANNFDYELLTLREVIRNDTMNGGARPWIWDEWVYVFKQGYYISGLYKETYSFFKQGYWEPSLLMDGSSNTYISQQLYSMEILSTTYYNIIVISHNIQQSDNPFKNIYYSKNVGVIRRDFFDGTIWELKSHYINN